jgi:hypothetical protein
VTSAVEGGRPKDPANAEDRASVKARYAVGCWELQAEKPSRAERRREDCFRGSYPWCVAMGVAHRTAGAV